MNGQYRIGDTVMKNWVIKKKLGEGSFGKVYRIEREEFGEVYHAALKIITVPQSDAEIQAALEEGMSPSEAEQYFYSMVEDIVREFALMAKVKGTAYVVSYEDHEVIRHTQGLGWDILIRMEELTGLLPYAYAHPFTRRDIIKLGIHMCQGLELCQKYNIIHRDIKPENIFVSENGDFKLGDFGIARTVEKTMSGLSKKGTYNYMAPEVYKGLEYGFSVDIYSLGIVMYRLLNKNRVPFLPPAPQKLTYASREQALARRMSGDEIPMPVYGYGRLGEIVLKACAYNPKDRYSSPLQMRQELEAILYDEQDAAIIYPEGDEVTLKENIYATMEQNRLKKQVEEAKHFEEDDRQVSATERINETRVRESAVRDEEEDDEDRTVSAFDQRKKAVKKEEPKKSGGKGGLIAVAVIAVAVIGGAAMFMGGGKDPGKDTPKVDTTTEADPMETAAEAYDSLMKQAEGLYDSDPAQAMAIMDQALAIYPDEAGAQTDYAYALYRTDNYDRCISYIEQDLELGRTFEKEVYASLMEILGAAYYEMGNYAQAAVAFKSSAMGGTMSESAMRDYAVCLARLGSVGEAKDVLADLRKTGANSDVTQYVEGEVSYAAQDYVEAEKIFNELLEYGSDRTMQQRAFRSLVQLYRDCASLEKLGNSPIEGAVIKQAQALLVGIDEFGLTYDTTLYEMLGKAAFEAYGKAQSMNLDLGQDYRLVAVDAFERVLTLGIQKDYLYGNLYSIHYEMGSYDAAAQVLDRMETAFPKNYVPHALRGILLITVENGKAEGDRNYQPAYEEYVKAKDLLTSSDDTAYFQQLESLITQLQNGNWL
ncbi:MAG: protein kinase [Lachnospiraceae bacterium]|nr:protein kinase [Lachnospiraceae bacterium]